MMDMHLIWVGRKRKYFCKWGWTGHFGKHEVICPSGKVFAGCVDGGGWVLTRNGHLPKHLLTRWHIVLVVMAASRLWLWMAKTILPNELMTGPNVFNTAALISRERCASASS